MIVNKRKGGMEERREREHTDELQIVEWARGGQDQACCCHVTASTENRADPESQRCDLGTNNFFLVTGHPENREGKKKRERESKNVCDLLSESVVGLWSPEAP